MKTPRLPRLLVALAALAAPLFLTAGLTAGLAACIDTGPALDDQLDDEAHEVVLDDPAPGQLVAGKAHACVIVADGSVRCWGAGTDGQLGDGGMVDRFAPVTAPLPARALALAAGDAHTCAVLVTGAVACWGDGSAGQTGATADLPTPMIVAGLQNVTALAAGSLHTCALTSSGRVRCWGANTRGQLGDSTGIDSVVPREVRSATGPLEQIHMITAGGDRTCALGQILLQWCWGDNVPDQNGPIAPASHYLVATSLNAVATSVATTGDTTCRMRGLSGRYFDCAGAMTLPSTAEFAMAHLDASDRVLCFTSANGGVRCRGANDRGQLATGNTTPSTQPVLVPLPRVIEVAVGDDFACALAASGAVSCWGRGDRGQIGDGTTGTHDRLTVQPVALGTSAVHILELDVGGSGNWSHVCALAEGGAVRCAGNNGAGQLGNGTNVTSLTATPVVGLADRTAIATGGTHSCAASASGETRCWGANTYGQLGNNSTTWSSTPVPTYPYFVDLAAGQAFVCGADSISIWCWGSNSNGQLGAPPSELSGSRVPRRIEGFIDDLTYMSSVEAGESHACALDRSGWLWCWGRNEYRQASAGSYTGNPAPWPVMDEVRDLALGATFTCAALFDGTVRCWGRNNAGQLGDGTLTNRTAPVQPKVEDVIAIAAGSDHACALSADGSVRCWGSNTWGQLGTGDNTLRTQPTAVALGGARVIALGAGGGATCAMRDDGEVLCWGGLGQGTLTPYLLTNVPTLVPGF